MTIKPYDFTEELAYLCGVFAGDGSLNIRKKKWEYSLKCVGNPKDERIFYDELPGRNQKRSCKNRTINKEM